METYPNKIEYIKGDAFEIDGATLLVTYSDGTTEIIPVTLDMVTVPDMDTVKATVSVKVAYEGKETSFNISIESGVVKVDCPISFKVGDKEVSNGFTMYTDALSEVTAVLPEGVQIAETKYTKDEGATDLGTKIPTEPGTYAFNVLTVENENYKATRAFVWFYIKAATTQIAPTIKYSIENGATVVANEGWDIQVSFYDGDTLLTDVEADIYYTENEVRMEGKPTKAGTYAINVHIVENEKYKKPDDFHEWFRWFNLELPSEKSEAEVTFGFENGTTFTYDGGDLPAELSVTVSEGADYEWWFSDEKENNLGHTLPTTPGGYSLVVKVNENDLYKAKTVWCNFKVTSSQTAEKLKAEVTFGFTRGEEIVYDGVTAPEKLTVTVSEGANWDWWFVDEREANLGKTIPTTSGNYTMCVNIVENDTYAAAYTWMPFILKVETGTTPVEKVEPSTTFAFEAGAEFTYDGVNIPEGLTFTAPEGSDYIWYYEDASEKNLGQTLPTTSGRYTLVVHYNENDRYTEKHTWCPFVLTVTQASENISLKKALPR